MGSGLSIYAEFWCPTQSLLLFPFREDNLCRLVCLPLFCFLKWDVQEKRNEGKKRREHSIKISEWKSVTRLSQWEMLNELLSAVEPFLQGFQDISTSAGQRTLPQVPGNPPVEGTSSSVVEGEVPQNDILTAVDIAERKQWQDLLSSQEKEWRLTERHFNLCESRISAIFTRTKSLYKEGHLDLNIKEEADIARGIDAYFADLNRFTSNQQRLQHIKRVHECIGNPKSRIWREIKGYMES